MTMPATPLRALTAVALCDGHDAAIVAVSRALRHRGFEVVYIGFHKSPADIVHAAVQEDVDVIGISSYNGGHAEFMEDVAKHLREAGRDIPIVCGGGGTITPDDVEELARHGVRRVFLPGETLDKIAVSVEEIALRHRRSRGPADKVLAEALRGNHAALGELITMIETGDASATDLAKKATGTTRSLVVGICGPGGAGKSTLIDEIALRWLAQRPEPLAILCSDPTTGDSHDGIAGGALLGDRIRMLAAENPKLFVRSFATRISGSMSHAVEPTVQVLRHGAFPLIIVESAGIGQSDRPFGPEIDLSVLVMTDEFGSPIQLEKMVALESTDVVVLNKCDRPASSAALSMIRSRLRSVKRLTALFPTAASRHRDPGVDALFAHLLGKLPAGA